MSEKVYGLIEKKVNKFGQLHLDAEQTVILLRWLKYAENSLDATAALLPEVLEVAEILKKLG